MWLEVFVRSKGAARQYVGEVGATSTTHAGEPTLIPSIYGRRRVAPSTGAIDGFALEAGARITTNCGVAMVTRLLCEGHPITLDILMLTGIGDSRSQVIRKQQKTVISWSIAS